MNPAAPLYPPKATPNSGNGDISAPQPTLQSVPQVAQSPSNAATPTPATSPVDTAHVTPSTVSVSARPVMSAKAAINAMYANSKTSPSAKLVPSAREAVNAASRLTPKNFKSAANLHHGSLQKIQKVAPAPRSLESTRTSASALFKTANSDSKDAPVVRTSLKLGANARPKDGPVILPAGSRMASAARPVANLSDSGDNSMVAVKRTKSVNSSTARRLQASGQVPKVILSGQPKLPVSRPRRLVRDPQMLNGGRRTLSAKSLNTLPVSTDQPTIVLPNQSNASLAVARTSRTPARPAAARASSAVTSVDIMSPVRPSATPSGNVIVSTDVSAHTSNGMSSVRKPARPRRFRTAPKNYAETEPSAGPVDSSYVISEPPKLAARRRSTATHDDLGVVKNYRLSKLPEPIGDAAPIGRLAEQRVASGHGGPARPEPSIKTENTSNYSFSRREDKTTKPAPYASVDQSPFLKSVTVEKRPLSDNSAPTPISLPRTAEPKPEKTSRKNTYQKKIETKSELPARPTVIVPSSRRSKAPLFFLIIFTIILGAAVGAAVYLCFFQ